MTDGHSIAETVAWGMKKISRRWGASLGDSSQSPVFIFAAGPGSGERELEGRLPFRIASEAAADAPLIAALANQLARLSNALRRDDAARSGNGEISASGIAVAIAAHGRLVAGLCRAWNRAEHGASWGITYTHLTAEHAHYLRTLFPRAKFILIHRNPVDGLKLHLAQTDLPVGARYEDLSARFAEQWRRLAVSLDQTAVEVGALVIGYDDVIAENCMKVEEYLGIGLLPLDLARGAATRESAIAELHASNLTTLLARVSGIASRLGYALHDLRRSEPRQASEAPRNAPHVCAPSFAVGASKCAVLVPTMRYVEPECDESLMELERRGYKVIRMRGCSAIDHARSRMATRSLEQGFAETLWVDADVCFDPDDVDRLRAHRLPIVAGVYARKRPRGGFAMSPIPGTKTWLRKRLCAPLIDSTSFVASRWPNT